jgi:hypothetical protein
MLGCGSNEDAAPGRPIPVKGKVLLEGKPVSGAIVVFHPQDGADPKAPRPQARTGSDGTFTLSTFKPHDGALAGRYAVTVLWQDGEEGTNLLPARYASPKTSGLRAEIKEGTTELPPFPLQRR